MERCRKNILITVFALTILIWGSYALYSGAKMAPDSYSYAKWADVLIANNFNVVSYQKTMDSGPTSLLYIGFIGLVAMTKIIAGSFWPQLIAVINIILGTLLAVMLADLIYIFTKSKLSVWVTFILYAFNFEIMLWSRFALSDISYMFLNFLIFYLIARAFLANNDHRARYWVVILFVFLANIFYRPTAIVMIPVVLFAFYLYNRKKDMKWKIFFVFLSFFVVISMLIHAAVIKNMCSLPPGKSILGDFAVFLYQKGIVIHDRPHTYHHVPSALLDYFFITTDKFIHYFYFLDQSFSLKHKVVNCMFFVPLYGLSVLGVISAAREQNNSIKRSLVALSVIVIVSYSLFHSVTLIDFDWRYRLPILPYMLFISGLGISLLAQMKRRKEDAGKI